MSLRSEMIKRAGLKPATLENLSLLMRFVRDYYSFDQIPFHEEVIRDGLKSLLGGRRFGMAWLILRQTRPVGYIVVTFGFDLEFGGRQATVTEFYVQPEHRGKGLGRMALEHVEEFARRAGARTLELQVTRGNSRAYAFYRSCGFQAHDRIPMSKRFKPRPLVSQAARPQRRELDSSKL